MARIATMGWFCLLVTSTACITMGARLSAGQATPAPGVSCANDLIQLLPCLNFLANTSASAILPACCTGLKAVSSSSPFCLCQLISPANSSQPGINDTRALQLPGLCSLSISPASCAAIFAPSAAASAPLPLVPAFAPAPGSIVPTSASPGPSVSCNSEINSLEGCLTFLNGAESTPSSSCCTNLGSVVSTTPQCLCALAESPAISSVNATLVQKLPAMCRVSASLRDCPSVGAPSIIPIGPGGPPGGNGVNSASSSSLYMVVMALVVSACAHTLMQ